MAMDLCRWCEPDEEPARWVATSDQGSGWNACDVHLYAAAILATLDNPSVATPIQVKQLGWEI